MPKPDHPRVVIPTITPAEAVSAANHLAKVAKNAFLTGEPERAVKLAEHAAGLVDGIDDEGADALDSMAQGFRKFIPGPVAPIAPPETAKPAGSAPAQT
jgi:hypothetical protein